MKVIAIHKDSSRIIEAMNVQQSDLQDFATQAVASFRRDLTDPDIHESRIVIIGLEGEPKVIIKSQADFIINPPENRPVQIETFTR